MPFTVIGGVPKTLTPAMLAAVGKTETPGQTSPSKAAYRADDLTLRVPVRAGTPACFCSVPGHAPGGMYGTLIVR